MMDLLAMAGEGANNSQMLGMVIGGIILVLFGGGATLGGSTIIQRRRNGTSSPSPGVTSEPTVQQVHALCPAHDGLVKLLDERKEVVKQEMDEIKTDIKDMRTENRDNFKVLFEKVDRLHSGG